MIAFQKPTLSDKPWVDALLSKVNYRGSEYNFTNLFLWKDMYHHEIAQLDGFLLDRVQSGAGEGYLFPAGQGDTAEILRALWADAAERGIPFQIICLATEQMEELGQLFPGAFQFVDARDGYDYLYDIDRLADLKGKKLHAKRNHINRFLEDNPTWSFEPITRQNLQACLEMDREWFRRSIDREGAGEAEDLTYENAALHLAMEHFESLGLEGGLLRIEGAVVAFTLGDRLGDDAYDVHFEKAFGEIQGAYAMINREFARWVRENHPEVRYLNREDDMGLENLRKAKLSYYPDRMVEKHVAILQRDRL